MRRLVASTMLKIRRLLIGFAILSVSLACGSEQAVQFTGAEPPDPASARLFWNGVDVTQHVALNAGETAPIEVRLFAANGQRIAGYDDHFEVALLSTPASLVHLVPASAQPLTTNVTAVAQHGLGGDLSVTWRHAHSGASGTFGPFDVLVH
jgi:hypothetical protein